MLALSLRLVGGRLVAVFIVVIVLVRLVIAQWGGQGIVFVLAVIVEGGTEVGCEIRILRSRRGKFGAFVRRLFFEQLIRFGKQRIKIQLLVGIVNIIMMIRHFCPPFGNAGLSGLPRDIRHPPRPFSPLPRRAAR